MTADAKSLARWFPYRRAAVPPNAPRLICFAPAGGGASHYRSWIEAFAPFVDVWPLQYAGRETRFGEPSATSVEQIANAVADLWPLVADRPAALFGHSFGGFVAFETVRELRRRGAALPARLFLSACPAPAARRDAVELSALSDDELKEHLRQFAATPPEVLEHEELWRLIAPILRADLGAYDHYAPASEGKLEVPVVAFAGAEDLDVPPQGVAAWQDEASRFRMRVVPGGHFFLQQAMPVIREEITRELREHSAPPLQ